MTPVWDSLWRLAAERQEIFFRRLRGEPPPWTADPVLLRHRFTNAYRAADRTSQHLIREVVGRGSESDDDALFRALLYKQFNKPATWEGLRARVGEPRLQTYRRAEYDAALDDMLAEGASLWHGAYMTPNQVSRLGFADCRDLQLTLVESMVGDGLAARLASAGTMDEAARALREYQTVGEFLSYQWAADLGYAGLVRAEEDSGTPCGPGSRDAAKKCGWATATVGLVRLIVAAQEDEPRRLGLRLRTLFGRRLSAVDAEHLLCEAGKYAREAHPEHAGRLGRPNIKQRYRPSREPLPRPSFPEAWGLGPAVDAWYEGGMR